MEVTFNSYFVSASGGTINFVSDAGELLASVAVPPGRVPVRDYLDLVPLGASVEISEGLSLIEPPHRVHVMPYGEGSHDSGANPDFQPTSASTLERQMRLMVGRMQADGKAMQARLRALESVERMPTRKADAEPELIEKGPAPTDEKAKVDGQ